MTWVENMLEELTTPLKAEPAAPAAVSTKPPTPTDPAEAEHMLAAECAVSVAAE
jgi:hypothetical protein